MLPLPLYEHHRWRGCKSNSLHGEGALTAVQVFHEHAPTWTTTPRNAKLGMPAEATRGQYSPPVRHQPAGRQSRATTGQEWNTQLPRRREYWGITDVWP